MTTKPSSLPKPFAISAMRRFAVTAALACAASLCAAQPASTGVKWNYALEIVVPDGAGSVSDQVAQTLGESLRKKLGTEVSVRNLPGGDGMQALDRVREPDAKVIRVFLANPDVFAVAGVRNVLERDFKPLTHVVSYSYALAMNSQPNRDVVAMAEPIDMFELAQDSSISNDTLVSSIDPRAARLMENDYMLAGTDPASANRLRALVADFRGNMNIATGTCKPCTLSPEVLAQLAAQSQLNFKPVSYPDPDTLTANLRRNDVNIAFVPLPAVWKSHLSGALQVVAASSNKRMPGVRNIPTFYEGDMPFHAYGWAVLYGVNALASTEQETLTNAIAALSRESEYRINMRLQMLEPVGRGPEDARELLSGYKETLKLTP